MSASVRSTWMRVAVIVLVLGGGLGVPAYGFAGGTGEPNNPYQIVTAADLVSIGSDKGLLGKCFALVNDIDLDPNLPGGRVFDNALIGRDTNPSATGSTGSPFAGVLDGRGHAIYRLHISGKDGYSAGLFGMCRGLVKDLHLKEVQVSGSPCGALAGTSTEAIFLNCSVTGKVTGASRVGGLIGNAYNATILDCASDIEVSGGSEVGGLVGDAVDTQIADARVKGTVTGTTVVGGLVGGSNSAMLLRCTAACKVTGTESVGGLIGDAAWSTTILHCDSKADVTGGSRVGGLVGRTTVRAQIVESRAHGTVAGSNQVGGLMGTAHEATIRGCAAACDVTGEQAAGGLVGDIFFGASLIDCYARGSVTGSMIGGLVGDAGTTGFPTLILNSYAACEMLGLSAANVPIVGGLLGGNRKSLYDKLVVSGCFWDMELSKVQVGAGSGSAYYGTGLTTQQMYQVDTFKQAGWNFDSVWTMPEGGYPILRWESSQDVKQP